MSPNEADDNWVEEQFLEMGCSFAHYDENSIEGPELRNPIGFGKDSEWVSVTS